MVHHLTPHQFVLPRESDDCRLEEATRRYSDTNTAGTLPGRREENLRCRAMGKLFEAVMLRCVYIIEADFVGVLDLREYLPSFVMLLAG